MSGFTGLRILTWRAWRLWLASRRSHCTR